MNSRACQSAFVTFFPVIAGFATLSACRPEGRGFPSEPPRGGFHCVCPEWRAGWFLCWRCLRAPVDEPVCHRVFPRFWRVGLCFPWHAGGAPSSPAAVAGRRPPRSWRRSSAGHPARGCHVMEAPCAVNPAAAGLGGLVWLVSVAGVVAESMNRPRHHREVPCACPLPALPPKFASARRRSRPRRCQRSGCCQKSNPYWEMMVRWWVNSGTGINCRIWKCCCASGCRI